MSVVDGVHVPWPLPAAYIRHVVGANWKPAFSGTPGNFEDAALSLMPRRIYETFVKEYNEKQWGVEASSLSADLCKRFDVRADGETRLTPHAKHQGLPVSGYAAWMQSMLQGIPMVLGADYVSQKPYLVANKVLVFTGPIDEYFGYEFGALQYRGQIRRHEFIEAAGCVQPCAQVNNPTHAGGSHIRTIEWKHMMPEHEATRIAGTIVTTETPYSPRDPSGYEYPFPDGRNAELYSRYRRRANSLDKVVIAGRLGEYRYLDMDQAIGRAFVVAERLLKAR